MYVNPF